MRRMKRMMMVVVMGPSRREAGFAEGSEEEWDQARLQKGDAQ